MEHFTLFFKLNFVCFVVSEKKIPSFARDKKYFFLNDDNLSEIFSEFLSDGAAINLVVVCKRPLTKVLRYLLNAFEFRKAAGGVVCNPDDERLMIYRFSKWDLPKGHVEKGETIRYAAVREVQEETGLEKLEIGNLIAKTYHIYNMDGCWILKQTAWYDMFSGAAELTPQTEEGIEKAVWVSKEQMYKNLATSYSSLNYLGEVLKKRDTI